jgi:SOS-response transcriptional repressor LexA
MSFSSRNAARDHLVALERKGMIQRTTLGSRNLRLTDRGAALLRGLRENLDASNREIVWYKGTRKIVVNPAPRAAGGILIKMFCRKSDKSPWRPDAGSRSEVWMPADAARHLALEIQGLTSPTKPFFIQLAEDDDAHEDNR